jgi:hypothetical protein
MSSYTRAFSHLSTTDPDNIAIPEVGVHYVRSVDDVPQYDIVQWWNPRYENGYCYVQMEYGYMEMEVDINVVWEDMLRLGQRPRTDNEMRWTVRDWEIIRIAFDYLRDGCWFSARFTVPSFDLQQRMPFWHFVMLYYRSMLLLGHEHIENGIRVAEDEWIVEAMAEEDRHLDGPEVIDLTGDASTATTADLTDIEDLWDP